MATATYETFGEVLTDASLFGGLAATLHHGLDGGWMVKVILPDGSTREQEVSGTDREDATRQAYGVLGRIADELDTPGDDGPGGDVVPLYPVVGRVESWAGEELGVGDRVEWQVNRRGMDVLDYGVVLAIGSSGVAVRRDDGQRSLHDARSLRIVANGMDDGPGGVDADLVLGSHRLPIRWRIVDERDGVLCWGSARTLDAIRHERDEVEATYPVDERWFISATVETYQDGYCDVEMANDGDIIGVRTGNGHIDGETGEDRD